MDAGLKVVLQNRTLGTQPRTIACELAPCRLELCTAPRSVKWSEEMYGPTGTLRAVTAQFSAPAHFKRNQIPGG
jgi:hypothetical protein